ncbi:S41 family peptidase [Galenea microaerophila]
MKTNGMKKGLWLLTGAVLGGALAVGTTVFADRDAPSTAQSESHQVTLPLEQLRSFAQVFELIKRDYVEPVSDDKILEGAISGMLSHLDPHSAYLPPKSFKEMEEHTMGEFGGLGMEVGMEDGFVKVIAPIDDTPAQRAGVQAGDLIIKIDDKPVKGMTLTDAVKLMRGKPGTQVTLTIVRKGEDKPLVLTLTRAVIKVKSVKQHLLPDGIGYVRISQFQIRTGKDLVNAIEKLKAENGGKLKGLILDLRNNPGGVLQAAVQVSDAFLDKGLIVYTKGRIKKSKMRFEAQPGDVLEGKPIVVLINEGSASASEIVSGALQDQHRALIAGRTSFGKGSVQTLMPLNNGGAIKLTTARYYTPSGRSIQNEGIVPDIQIERVKLEKLKKPIFDVKEKDLSGHLAHKDDKKVKPQTAKQKADQKAKQMLSKDFELHEAYSLVKGMAFVQQKAKYYQ